MTRAWGLRCSTASPTSMPDIPGIRMSMRKISTLFSSARRSVSMPLRAVPSRVIPCSAQGKEARPFRMAGSSSEISSVTSSSATVSVLPFLCLRPASDLFRQDLRLLVGGVPVEDGQGSPVEGLPLLVAESPVRPEDLSRHLLVQALHLRHQRRVGAVPLHPGGRDLPALLRQLQLVLLAAEQL